MTSQGYAETMAATMTAPVTAVTATMTTTTTTMPPSMPPMTTTNSPISDQGGPSGFQEQHDLAETEGFVFDQDRRNASSSSGRPSQAAAAVILALALRLQPILKNLRASVAASLRTLGKLLGLDKLVSLVRSLRAVYAGNATKINAGIAAVAAAYWLASKKRQRDARKRAPQRVAVIGSGIAGMGAAWTLNRGGKDVVLYEKKPKLGGNAKAMTWDVDGHKVETGLAVLAWPHQYFHNYNALIDELGIEYEEHELRFFVTERQKDGSTNCVFAHGRENWEPDADLAKDLKNWDRLYRFVKRVNAVFQPSPVPSMYRVGFANPLNLIPLRVLCKFFGVSQRFWNLVFVPIHTSTFLEVEMETLPATMAEVLNEVVPFTETPLMRAWKTHSYDTIKTMASELPTGAVRTSCAVESARYVARSDGSGFDIHIMDEDGKEEVFDAIVFACSAPAMNQILHGKGATLPGQVLEPNKANGLNNINDRGVVAGLKSRLLNALESTLLDNIMYTTDRDKTFEKGVVHSDADAVLPSQYKDEVLESYCNYVEVDAKNPREIENSFVISSWAPTVRHPDVQGKRAMLVSYNADSKLDAAGTDAEWVSTSREAHPCLTLFQLASSVVCWPFLQGARNGQTYFCGSAVLPANGHDLSFLSGVVAANELGAPYPFAHDPTAHDDYLRLRKLMLRFWA
ncbi:L-amino-acid oxidase [Hondaea fermentalgiana]|uniref:L-amino-acid oxidase n=1 Tax=Hondaea fermentalgiana TaxID=2315210 RepID=A0A2R5GJZ4_9STRA|nr:L-amino-acid oxidase [Hondaea fermentalgiana]|eukprot:GBG31197.1 L-amino-acid oxidase [Hondaea fermentalgiana]